MKFKMLRWKKFRALWASVPLPDREKADLIVERICGGLSVWVTHYDITAFMTKERERERDNNPTKRGGIKWNFLHFALQSFERILVYKNIIFHITF